MFLETKKSIHHDKPPSREKAMRLCGTIAGAYLGWKIISNYVYYTDRRVLAYLAAEAQKGFFPALILSTLIAGGVAYLADKQKFNKFETFLGSFAIAAPIPLVIITFVIIALDDPAVKEIIELAKTEYVLHFFAILKILGITSAAGFSATVILQTLNKIL